MDKYNGLPDADGWTLDLSRCGDSATVLGVGNVALDVARILLSPVDQLRGTDITEEALEMLARSSIRNVYIVGEIGE